MNYIAFIHSHWVSHHKKVGCFPRVAFVSEQLARDMHETNQILATHPITALEKELYPKLPGAIAVVFGIQIFLSLGLQGYSIATSLESSEILK